MKPGHGEVLLAEGDVEVARGASTPDARSSAAQLDSGMWAAVPTTAGGGRREAQLVRSLRRGPARRRPRDLLPAGRRAARLRPRWSSPSAPRRSSSWRCCGRLAIPHDRGAGASARRARRRDRVRPPVRPGPRAARRAARARAAALVRERRGVGDVPRPRLPAGVGPARGRRPGEPGRAAAGAPYAYLVYPHKPIVAYLPQTARAAQRVLRAVPRRHAALRQRAAAGLRRRAREVDGADRRRAPPDREREHAPARAARSTPKQIRRDLWRLAQWEQERLRRAARNDGHVAALMRSRPRPARIGCPRCPRTSNSTSSTAAAP